MTNNGGSGSAAAAAADEPAFPALILDGLHRHLGKLRQATTQFAAAPTEVLTWTQSQPLHDAIALLLQSGERVRDTTTKFSLVLGSAPAATDSVKSISEELRAAGDSLVAALGVLVDPAARAGAGRPLMELYCQQVRGLLRALEDLVRHVADKCLLPSTASTGAAEVAPKTGVVWAACEQLGKLPRSNKVAFRRAILQHQAAVRDTLREFGEMLAEGGGEEEEEVGEEEDDDEDDLFGGGGGPLSAWEKENVTRCLVALGHCGELMKAALGAVDESAAGAGAEAAGAEVMDAVVRIEESCEALTAAVVNAADALYPPQDPQELESQLGALVEAATVVTQGVAQLPSLGPSVARCMAEGGGLQEAVAAGVVRGEEDAAES